MPLDRGKISRNADKLVQQGKHLQAAREYAVLLKESPNDLILINKIGDLLARAGRTAEAVRHFERIGDTYTQGGFFLKAIAIYKKIIKLDPKSSESILRLADLYAHQDLVKDAREMYFEAARQVFARRETMRARDIYEKLLRMEPDRVETHTSYAEVLQMLGDHQRATAELALAASLLAAQGRAHESEGLFRQAFGSALKDPVSAALLLRGMIKSGASSSAVTLAEQLHAQYGDHPVAVDAVVDVYLSVRQTADAERIALAAIGKVETPGSSTLTVLARLHHRQGRTIEAVQAAVQVADDLVSRQLLPDAKAILDEFCKLSPGSVPLLNRRVEVGRLVGDREGTILALEELIRAYETAQRPDLVDRTREQLSAYAPERMPAASPAATPRPGSAPSAAPSRKAGSKESPARPASPASGSAAKAPTREEIEVLLDEEDGSGGGDEGLFDLSGDIAESLAKALGESPEAPPTPPEDEQSLGEVLAAFRQKVREEVGDKDTSTHYELGIAFKEMGLYDEAIGEFQLAAEAADRFFDCCSLAGMCHREKGDPDGAEEWFRRALERAVSGTPEQRIAVSYDLGEVLAEKGDWGGARDAFEEVSRANKGYREVRDRLREARERVG